MTDLHERLTVTIQARLDKAVAAQQPSDAVPISIWEEGFTKITQALEAEIERHCRADLKRLTEHRRCRCDYATRHGIQHCYTHRCGTQPGFPCPEVLRIATTHMID